MMSKRLGTVCVIAVSGLTLAACGPGPKEFDSAAVRAQGRDWSKDVAVAQETHQQRSGWQGQDRSNGGRGQSTTIAPSDSRESSDGGWGRDLGGPPRQSLERTDGRSKVDREDTPKNPDEGSNEGWTTRTVID